jgi:hypothetical protein
LIRGPIHGGIALGTTMDPRVKPAGLRGGEG